MRKNWLPLSAAVLIVAGTLAVGGAVPAGADGSSTPAAPTGVAAAAGNGQLTVTWSPPADPGSSAVTSYTATVADSTSPGTDGDGNQCTYTVPTDGSTETDTCVITELVATDSYTVTVVATNASGDGTPSDASSAVSPGMAPDAPTAVVAQPGDSQAAVSWTAPGNAAASGVTGYVVAADDGISVCAADGTQTSCTVTGLTNGTGYTFTVTAHNAYGSGPASGPSASTTPATVPGAPTGVSSTSGDGTATVSWGAPADDGGSQITGYVAMASDGVRTCSTPDGSTTSCQITGLTDGTAYTFSVVATNAQGSGAAGTDWVGTTPAAAPGAPTAVTGTPEDGQALVAWAAPTSDGGSPITSYTVASSDEINTCSTSSTSCVVTGLADGSSFTFTVTAANAVGTGPSSTPSAPVTPVGAPGAPTGVSATTADSQATVSWTAPAAIGGTSITGYTVTASDGFSTCSTADGTTTSCTILGLTDGTAYTFSVTATNAAGTSAASASSSSVTPVAPPGPPTGLSVTPHNQRVDVSWSAPTSSGGSPITGYTVLASDGVSTCTTASTECTVDDLTDGTAYTFTVVAINAVGPGPASTASTSVIPTETVPGSPTDLVATPGNGQVAAQLDCSH